MNRHPYAELYTRSNFTFLVGASQPEALVERAAAKLYSALALTDECTLSGVVRAHLEAREAGLHFIVGIEIQFSTAAGTPFVRLVLLAQDRRGCGNLSQLITLARRRAGKGSYQALVADLEGKSSKAPHLAGMPGCLALLVPDADVTVEHLFGPTMWLRTWFPNRAWIVRPRTLGMTDELDCHIAQQAAERAGLKIVASTSALMHIRFRKRVQDVVTAICLGKEVSQCAAVPARARRARR